MKIKIDNIQDHLKEHGIKPSLQRIRIFSFLINTDSHPTVDTIYNGLVDDIPTLSKTTVYNTLKLFQEKGVAVVVNIENNEVRFDADTSFHGHFKCSNCGIVYDFISSEKGKSNSSLNGFKIEESHYYLKGVCKNCNNFSNFKDL